MSTTILQSKKEAPALPVEHHQVLLATLARVAPVWELERYVAVNPFLGMLESGFEATMRALEQKTGRSLVNGGMITPPSKAVTSESPAQSVLDPVLGPFCAAYYAPGHAAWSLPWKHLPLFGAWLNSAALHAGLPSAAARSLKKRIATLGSDCEASSWLAEIVERYRLSPVELATAIDAALADLGGWAAWMRRLEWPQAPAIDGPLHHLAVMALTVFDVLGRFDTLLTQKPAQQDFDVRLTQLKKREADYQQALLRTLSQAPRHPVAAQAPELRILFCIDVRSEVIRRHLEHHYRNSRGEHSVQTEGCAGFFGLPLAFAQDGVQEEPHCPALLKPGAVLQAQPSANKLRVKQVKSWVSGVKASKPTTYLWVEGSAPYTLWQSMKQAVHNRTLRVHSGRPTPDYDALPGLIAALPLSQRLQFARQLLTLARWHAGPAQVVVFAGHGAHSTNNPHHAALQCGACGGKSGELNARASALLLNDPELRQALAQEGTIIPEGTLFVAALHHTHDDNLEIFSETGGPSPRPEQEAILHSLEVAAQQAAQAARAEREKRFGFRANQAHARAYDRSATRIEAALAGNAAFIIGPRTITESANLEGRTFLHSYDEEADPEGNLLRAILGGPMVVTSWINLQYFASTTDPIAYGAGNKLIHSVVGTIGVTEGMNYDLKTGLSMQSLTNDGKSLHTPQRLLVLVCAPRERTVEILKQSETLSNLCNNGWVHLLCREKSGSIFAYQAGGSWTPCHW